MTLTVRLLGLELLHVDITTDSDNGSDPGDCVSTPVGVGFTRTWLGETGMEGSE